MSLDYGNTCPIIDDAIDSFETVVEEKLKDFAEEICPYINIDLMTHLLEKKVRDIKHDFGNYAEEVRDSNVDMREVADQQIEDLQLELDELKDSIELKESLIHTLEERIDELVSEKEEIE